MSDLNQFIIFTIIGVFNTALDITLWNILYRLFFKIKLKIRILNFSISNYLIAHTISFTITSIISYFLNNSITFGDSKKDFLDWGKLFSFFGVTIFTFSVTTLILHFLTGNFFEKRVKPFLNKIEEKYTLKSGILVQYWPTVAKIITVGFGTFSNFFGYKLFVF